MDARGFRIRVSLWPSTTVSLCGPCLNCETTSTEYNTGWRITRGLSDFLRVFFAHEVLMKAREDLSSVEQIMDRIVRGFFHC